MCETKIIAPWLWLLLALFCFRVLAQLLQSTFNFIFLPVFNDWHSGALPYSLLLISQVLIIVLMTYVCVRFTQGNVIARRSVGIMILVPGMIYFLTMLSRLLIGLFVTPEHNWFGQVLPAVFHLVLALFALVVGYFHYSCSDSTMKR